MRTVGRRSALLATVLVLVAAGSAWAAFRQLPPGAQVNDDPAAGIDPNQPVDLSDPTNADVVGGALDPTRAVVPWSIFRQKTTGAEQIFTRSYSGGAWLTRGHGTVGGVSSAAPTFAGSLNFDQGVDGEVPTIDFAGTGRAVPWATWYEETAGFGGTLNVFASKFDAAQDKWVFAGQSRSATPSIPSLNIHTFRDAENPNVAGGAAVAGNDPVPWIAWQELDGGTPGPDQIFVSKGIGPNSTNCVGVKPAAVDPNATPPGGFCFQQVGLERLDAGTGGSSATGDPSLSVDPSRDGIEPDNAFTGTNDTVPWVVWYETGASGLGLGDNDMVFAAKATVNPTADGGFQWTTVGAEGRSPGTGVLDTSGATNHFGTCAESLAAEQSCSLNADPTVDAEQPRVAAGTMTPGQSTVPWVAWGEQLGGHERIFVSRLVGNNFRLANGGQPLPTLVAGIDATHPDITFSGNTPYVTWHEGGSVVTGHFSTPDGFTIDNGAVGSNVSDAVRAPISSSCTADPFNADGAHCQGGAAGTPFFLYTDGDALTAKLFADAYDTGAPTTGDAGSVGETTATVLGAVDPQGGPVKVQFQFGATTAYGSATDAQRVGPANAAIPFAGLLTGLPAGTTIHYRAVATTDFGTVVGADRTLTTTAPPLPPPPGRGRGRGRGRAPHVKLGIAKVTIKQLLRAGTLKVTVSADKASRVSVRAAVAVKSHRRGRRPRTTSVTLGTASVRFTSAGSKAVSIRVTRRGLRTLGGLRSAKVAVTARATDAAGNHSTKTTSRTLRRG